MSTDCEAVKAGAKEAVTEWLETHPDRIETGVKSAVLDWIELTGQGSCAIDSGAERAVTAWLAENRPALLQALAEAVANRRPS